MAQSPQMQLFQARLKAYNDENPDPYVDDGHEHDEYILKPIKRLTPRLIRARELATIKRAKATLKKSELFEITKQYEISTSTNVLLEGSGIAKRAAKRVEIAAQTLGITLDQLISIIRPVPTRKPTLQTMQKTVKASASIRESVVNEKDVEMAKRAVIAESEPAVEPAADDKATTSNRKRLTPEKRAEAMRLITENELSAESIAKTVDCTIGNIYAMKRRMDGKTPTRRSSTETATPTVPSIKQAKNSDLHNTIFRIGVYTITGMGNAPDPQEIAELKTKIQAETDRLVMEALLKM